VEPGGAVGLAAVLSGKIDGRGRNIGLIASGGNVDKGQFSRILAGG
jgi:threonine dehydratase